MVSWCAGPTDESGSMTDPSATRTGTTDGLRSIRIHQSRALSYRVVPGGTSRRYINYIVELRSKIQNDHEIKGLGEGQPRGKRTGDDAGKSWAFLEDAVSRLYERELVISDVASAIEQVRDIMSEMTALARDFALDSEYLKPFRGTLLGIESALLDLLAKALETPLAVLLGQVRHRAPLSPPLVSPRSKPATFRRKITKQFSEYSHLRLAFPSDVSRGLEFLEKVSEQGRIYDSAEPKKSVWLEVEGALDWANADELLRGLMRQVEDGLLPTQVVVEQPLRSAVGEDLVALQRLADQIVVESSRPETQLVIMADGPVWDHVDFEQLAGTGPFRSVNIRPAKSGGLLAGLDLANAALQANPNAVLGLTRMPGASRVSTAALKHLALAMPGVDGVVLMPTVEKALDITERVLPNDGSPESVVRRGQQPLAASPEDMEALAREERDFVRHQKITPDRSLTDEDRDQVNEESSGDDLYDDHLETDEAPEVGRKNAFDDEDTVVERQVVHDEVFSSGTWSRGAEIENVPGLGIRLLYIDLINATLDFATTPMPPPLTYGGRSANTYDDVDFIRPIGSYAVHGHIVEREALAHGLNTQRFHKRKFLVSDGKKRPLPFQTSRWPLSSVTASALARHKEAVRIRLGRFGIPVPQGRTFSASDQETAVQYAERIGFPVVLKPAEGSMGIGVTANIQSADEVRDAFELLQQSRLADTEFIVEQHVHGSDYRIMVIKDKVIAAVQRLPAFVVGDGRSTVAELIMQKNAIKRKNPHLGPLKMKWDPSSKYALAQRGYNASSTIPAGETIFLASANNLSQGGDSIDVLDEMHPSILEASVEAVRAVPGLTYCGVDFLLADHRKSINEQDAAVCELNAQASVPVGEYPMFGTPRKMAERFLMECVETFGLENTERKEHLNLRMVVRGKVTRVGYRAWFARRANEFGCSGWIRNVDDREVEIHVSGPTRAVTALSAAAILGPRKALPTSVVTTHLTEVLSGSFEIEMMEDSR